MMLSVKYFIKISIPLWCDWKNQDLDETKVYRLNFNSSLVRLEVVKLNNGHIVNSVFQFLFGAIGRRRMP